MQQWVIIALISYNSDGLILVNFCKQCASGEHYEEEKTIQAILRANQYLYPTIWTTKPNAIKQRKCWRNIPNVLSKPKSMPAWEVGSSTWPTERLVVKTMSRILASKSRYVPSFEEYLAHIYPEDRPLIQEVLIGMSQGKEPKNLRNSGVIPNWDRCDISIQRSILREITW